MARSHTFTLKFRMDNAAFFDEDGKFRPGPELTRILGEMAQRVRAMSHNPECRYPVLDENGNVIGEGKIT